MCRMFMYEAFILELLVAGIGGASSLVIGYSVVDAMIGTTVYFFQPVSIMYIPAAMVVGVAVCVISGTYSPKRTSNMDPFDTLRSDGREKPLGTDELLPQKGHEKNRSAKPGPGNPGTGPKGTPLPPDLIGFSNFFSVTNPVRGIPFTRQLNQSRVRVHIFTLSMQGLYEPPEPSR